MLVIVLITTVYIGTSGRFVSLLTHSIVLATADCLLCNFYRVTGDWCLFCRV